MGLIVYIAYEEEAKAKVHVEETENRLLLRGKDEEPQRLNLIRQHTEAIAHETEFEKCNDKSLC